MKGIIYGFPAACYNLFAVKEAKTRRERALSRGWYPDTGTEVAGFCRQAAAAAPTAFDDDGASAVACLSPHAGWAYSGGLAVRAISRLDPGATTVAVFGGHLPGGYPPLLAYEDEFAVPGGAVAAAAELRAALDSEFVFRSDRYADNTVEALLPIVDYFFPGAEVLWLRLPADADSFGIGRRVAGLARAAGGRCVAVASTDLTHYGPAYGFAPRGSGRSALRWMREVNDAAFLAAVLAGEPGAVLERAEKDRSACSAGAVLGALGFASEAGPTRSLLLGYGTSADARPAEDFVGYGAVAWTRSSSPKQ
jgi:AmmeMemoRadiSam system protein B